ncbi:Retrovirus-related Pol polyprotein from transposon TNT 1-94 [Dendrobium catenatum]|uniref:Retrovirus-related Pol polyprotein from transposon TNT 1-94 n=1 Tax=Dendrobium catenatum TaxID=906689 RepID=A0A2I0VG13_9ASPA|nr:Retrovirus-related Pol polyprotein from transposon TNT 1-94 [Dendrobium catenatum]
MINTQFNKSIKIFRSDGGGEFINGKFQQLFKHLGILHQYSCPYTPAQNGVAEMKHRHIVEAMRSLLLDANLPVKLWVEAMHASVYLINRLPSRALQNRSPYQILYQKPSAYNHLKIFGCLCYPWLRPYSTSKLSTFSIPCVFIGYASAQKGYRCLDPKTGKVYISRHVIFNEAIFPYHQPDLGLQQNSSNNFIPPLLLVPTIINQPHTSTQSANTPSRQSYHASPQVLHPTTDNHSTIQSNIPESNSSLPITTTTAIPRTLPQSQSTHSMQTRSKTGHSKPKQIFSLAHIIQDSDPTTYSEAAKSPHWLKAMHVEFQALQSQHTWDLVPPDSTQNVLGCKWTYRTKYLADGSVARHKARLVAQGFSQEYGLNYAETFSPVAKMPTVRILITIAMYRQWPLHQLDVSNAFLHGNLCHTVHMKQPVGFVDKNFPNHVCRLRKSLYGLKQSPREWFATLSGYLQTLGFNFSDSDPSLLIYNRNGIQMFFLVYVDDILLTGNSNSDIQNLLRNLQNKFTMRDLGSISQFLGIHAVPTSYGLHLTQSQFAQSILSRACMLNCKPVSTPSQIQTSSSSNSSAAFSNPTLYRQLAGCLQYLTLTRPDIAYAVNKICQHMQSPTNSHFEALKRLLRYIQGSLHTGLPIFRDTPILQAYADSDWAGDAEDRKSISGYCNFLGSTLISWSVKKQNAVARSSTEAEYRALASAAAEITWIRRLLQELNCSQTTATPLFCDNVSAIALANNPVFHARTKHIEVDCHYIRHCIKNDTIQVHHLSTKDQIADLFTKALPSSRFKLLAGKLVQPLDSPS